MADNTPFSAIVSQSQSETSLGSGLPIDQPPEHQSLAKKIKRDLKDARPGVEAFRKEARKAQSAYDSHQWDADDLQIMRTLKRPALVFNEIKPIVDSISGIERLNRVDVRVVSRAVDSPVEEDALGDLATAALSAAVDLCSGDEERSRACKDLAVVGMGWTEDATRYDVDPDGRVIVERIPWDEMLWDSDSTKENLEDARWVARERKWRKELFAERWPDMVDTVAQAAPEDPTAAIEKYELVTPYYSAANQAANPQIGRDQGIRKSITVVQYQWREMVPMYRYIDPPTPQGELRTVREDEWRSLVSGLKKKGIPAPPHAKQQMPICKQAYYANGIILEEEVELPHGFSLLAMTGLWDQEDRVWYGLVRPMMDPQKTMNKAISSALTFTISNAKGGVMFEPDAFINEIKAKEDWSKPDAWIQMQPGGAQKIVQRQSAQIPPELSLYYQTGQAAISRVSGINEEVIGVAQGETGNPAQRSRIAAGLAILGWYFDAIARYRRTEARCMLEFIREYWSHGQLIEVGGDFNAQHAVPLMKESLPIDYTLALDDSVRHNPNLKAQIWQDLQGIMPALLRYGFGRFLLLALKFSPLPTQLIQALWKEAQQGPSPAQVKGDQGKGKGGKQVSPEETAAKVAKMQADTEKSKAETRLIDTERGIKAAEVVLEGLSSAHDHQHKMALMQHRTMSDVVKAVRANRMASAGPSIQPGQGRPQNG